MVAGVGSLLADGSLRVGYFLSRAVWVEIVAGSAAAVAKCRSATARKPPYHESQVERKNRRELGMRRGDCAVWQRGHLATDRPT